MQVIFHAGAHMTDEGGLIKCLRQNRAMLAKNGIEVPSPNKYHIRIRDTMNQISSMGITEAACDELFDAIVEDDGSNRLILSNQGFFGTPKMAASGGTLYQAAEMRMGYFQQMFPDDQVELFLGTCNPATFLPALLEKVPFDNMADFLNNTGPLDVHWSHLIERIRKVAPNMPITIWCNEDTPLIWAQVMRAMAGLDEGVPLKGEFGMLAGIMTKSGMQRFEAFIVAHPNLNEQQKRQVIIAFMDKYADESKVEKELDVPGWTHELIDRMTEVYDADMDEIAHMPGVHMISP